MLAPIPMPLAKSVFVSPNIKLINCSQAGFNILNNKDCLFKNSLNLRLVSILYGKSNINIISQKHKKQIKLVENVKIERGF